MPIYRTYNFYYIRSVMVILTICVLRTQGLCIHVLAFVCALIIAVCLKHTGCMCISMSQYL